MVYNSFLLLYSFTISIHFHLKVFDSAVARGVGKGGQPPRALAWGAVIKYLCVFYGAQKLYVTQSLGGIKILK